MKVTSDDFKRTYAELSDDALLALDREDLTEVARSVYDDERKSRGLATEESEAVAEEASAATAAEGDLVEVARFDNTDELEFARSLLKSADIPSFLSNDPALAESLPPDPHHVARIVRKDRGCR